jgi:hypothetical protein
MHRQYKQRRHYSVISGKRYPAILALIRCTVPTPEDVTETSPPLTRSACPSAGKLYNSDGDQLDYGCGARQL